MSTAYKFVIANPVFTENCSVEGISDGNEPHDRSAPTDYHWKILKCRMIIFSESSVLASPDQADIKKIHIVYRATKNDHEKVCQLFKRFRLSPGCQPKPVTLETYEMCLKYTMTARLAPTWNLLGQTLYVNNRDFLTTSGMQDCVDCTIKVQALETTMTLRALKINILRMESPRTGDSVRVLPSLFKAVVNAEYEKFPETGLIFRTYKDLKRHWKNIHGYRLPEEEGKYYSIRFWRGEPLTYPEICILPQYPIKTPLPKNKEVPIINKFVECLEAKMPAVLGNVIAITPKCNDDRATNQHTLTMHNSWNETQPVSLCTPTQRGFNFFPKN